MNNLLEFPLQFTFKITTISNDFTAIDANGYTIAYVRSKLFRLFEHVEVFTNENRSQLLLEIRANKWLDFNTSYTFTNAQGSIIGRLARKGWASLWKAHYEIYDDKNQPEMTVREENPWAKIFDGMLGEFPGLAMLSGYLFHPSYLVTNTNGNAIARLRKIPSFWGRKFTVEKLGNFTTAQQNRMVPALMMMILLEKKFFSIGLNAGAFLFLIRSEIKQMNF